MLFVCKGQDHSHPYSHIQRISRLSVDLQPRQRLRTIIGLIHCPAVVVIAIVEDCRLRGAADCADAVFIAMIPVVLPLLRSYTDLP